MKNTKIKHTFRSAIILSSKEVGILIDQYGVNHVERFGSRVHTLLMVACEESNLDMVKHLIKKGANVNFKIREDSRSFGEPRDNSQITYKSALSVTSFTDKEILACLLEAGADPYYVYKTNGERLIDMFPEDTAEFMQNTILMLSIKNDHNIPGCDQEQRSQRKNSI